MIGCTAGDVAGKVEKGTMVAGVGCGHGIRPLMAKA